MWGIGTRFQVLKNGSWDDISGIKSITPPGMTTDMADATVLFSETNTDGVEEKQPTLHRTGEATLVLLFEPGNEKQKDFLQNQRGRNKLTVRILYPDNANYYQFDGYVSGFEQGDITPEGLLETTVTFTSSGAPKFGDTAGIASTKLESLVIDGVELTPAFSPNERSYFGETDDAKNELHYALVDQGASAVATINSLPADNNADLNWVTGEDNYLKIVVTKDDAETIYLVVVKHNE